MAEIRYYDFIVESNIENTPIKDIEWYLQDTSSGISIFTKVEFAQQRWRETFGYLLPRLIKRGHEQYLLSDLIAYFFLVNPDSIPDAYPECRMDILNTLGNAIMGPAFWDEHDLATTIIQREWNIYRLFGANDFDLILSPAMYWCLKYLTLPEINTWTESLVQIRGNYWHYFLMNWLFKEAFQLLIYFDDVDLPDFQTVKSETKFGVHAEISEFQLPTANVLAFISKLKEHGLYLSLSTTSA